MCRWFFSFTTLAILHLFVLELSQWVFGGMSETLKLSSLLAQHQGRPWRKRAMLPCSTSKTQSFPNSSRYVPMFWHMVSWELQKTRLIQIGWLSTCFFVAWINHIKSYHIWWFDVICMIGMWLSMILTCGEVKSLEFETRDAAHQWKAVSKWMSFNRWHMDISTRNASTVNYYIHHGFHWSLYKFASNNSQASQDFLNFQLMTCDSCGMSS